MSNTILSLIRTYVPIAVGALVAWLLTLGVTLDPASEAGLTVAGTGLLIATYYTLIRLLERRWPWVGILLGSAQAPTYSGTVALVNPATVARMAAEADAQAAANDGATDAPA